MTEKERPDTADDGAERARSERRRAEWLEEAEAGLANEAERLATEGPLLARYRRVVVDG